MAVCTLKQLCHSHMPGRLPITLSKVYPTTPSLGPGIRHGEGRGLFACTRPRIQALLRLCPSHVARRDTLECHSANLQSTLCLRCIHDLSRRKVRTRRPLSSAMSPKSTVCGRHSCCTQCSSILLLQQTYQSLWLRGAELSPLSMP